MYKKQARLMAREEGILGDMETGTKAEDAKNDRITIIPREREDLSRDGTSRDGSEIELTDHTRRSRTS